MYTTLLRAVGLLVLLSAPALAHPLPESVPIGDGHMTVGFELKTTTHGNGPNGRTAAHSLMEYVVPNLDASWTAEEAAKVEPSLSAQPGVDAAAIVERLPGFEIGQFVMTSPDNFAEPVDFKVRWLVTSHYTVEESRIEELTRESDRERNG